MFNVQFMLGPWHIVLIIAISARDMAMRCARSYRKTCLLPLSFLFTLALRRLIASSNVLGLVFLLFCIPSAYLLDNHRIYILQGLMMALPLVGMVAACEVCCGLWTRQIAVILITATPMMAASHLIRAVIGLRPSLGVGWLAPQASLFPLARCS